LFRPWANFLPSFICLNPLWGCWSFVKVDIWILWQLDHFIAFEFGHWRVLSFWSGNIVLLLKIFLVFYIAICTFVGVDIF
jgi:hypothetical protein